MPRFRDLVAGASTLGIGGCLFAPSCCALAVYQYYSGINDTHITVLYLLLLTISVDDSDSRNIFLHHDS
jgi:hypothetical protein